MLDVLRKVLQDRYRKNLQKFASKVKRTQDKYNHLQSFEEKSFVKLKPSKSIKDVLSGPKAASVFESYNRERDYMARSRSGSRSKSPT